MEKPDRRALLLKYVTKEKIGLEIGPYVNPLAPKSEGYDVRVLDVFDQKTLIRRASKDPYLDQVAVDCIEPVDFVLGATEIGELAPSLGGFF